ncbi:MAG: hypothetical protein SWH78_18080, partial [Thermodesulfobacteriota bacterium]|nr:hypothetical protein [Thermodesulfobacteriota bacterium]
CHVMRVPAPERKGVTKSAKQKEREEKFGPPTLLVVSDINTLPWEKKDTKKKAPGKPSGTAGKKKATKKTNEDEADSGDVETKATEVILDLIEEYGTLKKKDLPTKIFQAMKNDPARNAVVKIVFDDEFLGNGPWEYEDGVISE